MSSNNFLTFSVRAKSRKKSKRIIKLFCFFLVLVFVLNFLYINDSAKNYNYSNNEKFPQEKEKIEKNPCNPEIAAGIELLQDPFTTNFSNIWDFFGTNYKSDLPYDISTYFRYSNSSGGITDDTVFSEDNLLLYKSLVRENYDESEIYQMYKELKSTPLWYSGNISQFNYGFVSSIDNSSGVIDTNRRLIDNLMPIFLLIKNNATLSRSTEVIEIFELINSSQFWDSVNKGFYEYNSSIDGYKHTMSNLYAILANILINRTSSDSNIKEDASNMASQTMSKLMENMWETNDGGFGHEAWKDWGPVTGGNIKYLEVNALGIIVLLEYWVETGMDEDSTYFKNATILYNKINKNLWNSTFNAFENRSDYEWKQDSLVEQAIDLEANAMMMRACLKLFEYTGNMTYYDKAFELFGSLEKYLYDDNLNAYNYSVGEVSELIHNEKNFHANLKLCEAYLEAFEIYNSTVLETITEENPYLIIGQDSLNVNCSYLFEKTNEYYYDFTIKYNMTSANITYIIRYPNKTIIKTENDYFDDTNTTLLTYNITENLPLENGYSVYIYANTTKFGMAFTTIYFNVISGLRNDPIIGLTDSIYQDQTINVELPIISNRTSDINLNVSLEGEGIETFTNNDNDILFKNGSVTPVTTSVFFNITAKNDAPPGPNIKLYFKIKNGSKIYLEVTGEIEILNALEYSNLIYSKKIVSGESIQVNLDLKNILTSEKQSLEISFSGTYIEDEEESETLDEQETKSVSYSIRTDDDIDEDSFEFNMTISKGNTIIYTETLSAEILPRLEVVSISFPKKVPQGVPAYFVIIIQNNEEASEEFTLFINGEKIKTETDELISGENRIEGSFIPTLNPYEFGTKVYKIEIEDGSDKSIVTDYFEIEIELSSVNLVVFYLGPILVIIAIILIYKNKDIKFKLLRR